MTLREKLTKAGGTLSHCIDGNFVLHGPQDKVNEFFTIIAQATPDDCEIEGAVLVGPDGEICWAVPLDSETVIHEV